MYYIQLNEIQIQKITGFCENVFRKDKKDPGGGILIAIHKSILVLKKLLLNTKCKIIRVKLQNDNNLWLYIYSFYSPPNFDSSAAGQFQTSLLKLTDKAKLPNVIRQTLIYPKYHGITELSRHRPNIRTNLTIIS